MTITVTPEELKEYHTKVEKWAFERARFVENLLVNRGVRRPASMEDLHASDRRKTPDEEIADWNKANPFPRLLPNL